MYNTLGSKKTVKTANIPTMPTFRKVRDFSLIHPNKLLIPMTLRMARKGITGKMYLARITAEKYAIKKKKAENERKSNFSRFEPELFLIKTNGSIHIRIEFRTPSKYRAEPSSP
jgi:hypothetical protein